MLSPVSSQNIKTDWKINVSSLTNKSISLSVEHLRAMQRWRLRIYPTRKLDSIISISGLPMASPSRKSSTRNCSPLPPTLWQSARESTTTMSSWLPKSSETSVIILQQTQNQESGLLQFQWSSYVCCLPVSMSTTTVRKASTITSSKTDWTLSKINIRSVYTSFWGICWKEVRIRGLPSKK